MAICGCCTWSAWLEMCATTGLDADARPIVYVNYFQRPAAAAEFSIVLRGHGDAGSV